VTSAGGLRVLVVDDEPPALEELRYLLSADDRIAAVHTAVDADSALRALDRQEIDALFLDIHMPGLSGLDLARVLAHFADPPQVVFVTAYETHAVDAFELRAADYLLKPVRSERLAEAIGRLAEGRSVGPRPPGEDDTIPAELGGVTTFVRRSTVRYAEAQGDYTRLHTHDGNYLIRTSLAALELEWEAAGFTRIHRSYLVALAYVEELRVDAGHCTVRIGGTTLAVSRRHTRELRDLLVRNARPGVPR
jgi:DNA-binding LytR/AlgR family response regulator